MWECVTRVERYKAERQVGKSFLHANVLWLCFGQWKQPAGHLTKDLTGKEHFPKSKIGLRLSPRLHGEVSGEKNNF